MTKEMNTTVMKELDVYITENYIPFEEGMSLDGLKKHEIAIQDIIEKHFEEELWWEVIDGDLFLMLMSGISGEELVLHLVDDVIKYVDSKERGIKNDNG